MATWRELISEEMEEQKDSWDNVVHYVLGVAKGRCGDPDQPGDLDREFDDGFGLKYGCPFTLWTKTRVYFPTDYDGSEEVRSVPREPCDEVTEHVGEGG